MIGTVGLGSLFLFPLVAGAGMALVGMGGVFAPSILLLMPFMLARV